MSIKILIVFAMSVAALQSCKTPKPATAEKAYKSEGYKLVWADEFNKDGVVDTVNWRFEKGFVRNNELQWYQEDNAWCMNGVLVIEGRKENKPNPRYEAGSRD